MNTFKALVFTVSLIAFLPSISYADHNAGGELTWECLANGKFKFTLKLYRYCEGIPLPSSAFVSSNSTVTSMTLPLVSKTDVSPKCYDSTLQMDCYGTNSDYTIEEYLYVSADIQISGVPPTSGWDFYWSSCCRPAPAIYNWGNIVDNLHPQNQSYRIKASMFPFNGQNTYPCYDNSPIFAANPTTIICTGYPFTYNHNAVDPDLDSLTYAWTTPLLSSGASVSYATHTNTPQPPALPRPSGGNFNVPAPGFSATVPLPWAHSNMNLNNVAASMDPFTGEIQFTSHTTGQYATAILVTAYRCNTKIAEIMRDIPVTLLACPPTPVFVPNKPPAVVFKWNANDPNPIPLPAGDTVYAGDRVEFYITSSDIQFRPPGLTGQRNYLIPGGSQFGNLYADTVNGCLFPPCATMDTTSVYYSDSANWWEGTFGIAADFGWTSDCNHIRKGDSCIIGGNKYNFVFKVLDDFCPAPGANFSTFTVTVLAPPAIAAPAFKCSKVFQNGDVQLTWDQPISKADDSLFSFRKYIIYRADSLNGTFDTLHVVQDIDSLEYLDATANALSIPRYYVLKGISSCNDQSVRMWSDTISSMIVSSVVYNSGSSVALDWIDFNPGSRFGSKTSGKYYVWQVNNNDTSLVDSTTQSWDSLDIYLCYPSEVKHFITVEDTSKYFGCTSYSNFVSDTVGDITPPNAVNLDSVSYDTSNNIFMSWQPASQDAYQYFIYKDNQFVDSILASQTSYQYNPLPTDSCNLGFSVSAVDSCGNVSVAGITQYSMCDIILDVIRCDTNKRITLGWDLYNPSWANTTSHQELWRSINAAPWTKLDSLGPFVNIYSDTSILGNTNYRYRVRNWEVGKTRSAWTSTVEHTVGSIIKGTIVPEPELRCISWLNDTTLEIQWRPPSNPDSNLNKYLIYHSNSPQLNTFSLIDSITGTFTSDNQAWFITSYSHVGVDPTLDNYYYVVSASGCDGQQPSSNSNVITPIILDITALNDSVNELKWNKLSPIQTGPQYEIMKNNIAHKTLPFGTEVDQDKWVVCFDSAEYYIRYDDPLGQCESISNSEYGVFADDTPPSKLFVDSVSMQRDSSFTAMVGWSAGSPKDIEKYVVLKCLPSSYQVLDTVSPSTFYYLDLANAPLEGIHQYSVTAIDSCGNNNLAKMDFDCHQTITLSSRLNKCAGEITLNWNAYDDFSSGGNVLYKVYVSRDGSPFAFHGSTMELSYKASDFTLGSYNCFYVQAWENNGAGPFSSSSALSCIRYQSIISPDYADLSYATVKDSGIVRLCMKIDLKSDLGEYWVKRSTEENANYSVIGTVPVPDPKTPADSVFCYEDKYIQTDKRSYYYKIDVTDPCGNVTKTTNFGRTILLNVSADRERNQNVLSWNIYEEWKLGVDQYVIFKQIGNDQPEVLASLKVANMHLRDEVELSGDEVIYRHDLAVEKGNVNGQFCYYIVAVEASASSQNLDPEVSQSNIDCASQSPRIYVPNSFTPNGDGINDRFMPAITFHEVKSFSMEVYNRWGEKIYASNDVSDGGWDGTYNGQPVPNGAYVYIVKYSSVDGQEYEDQGTVTITR